LIALERHVSFELLINMPVREQIGRMKYTAEAETAVKFAAIKKDMESAFAALLEGSDLNA